MEKVTFNGELVPTSVGGKKMRVYISGKMTGMREEDSRALFSCGCSVVECCGHEPVNPWNVNEYMPNATTEELMQEDLRIIREEADALFVLANYHTSAGAHREIAEAITKGIPVYYDSNVSEFYHRCFVSTNRVVDENTEVEQEELEEA